MRRYLLPVLLGSLLLLSACSAPDPGVTMYSGGTSARLSPLQYCNASGTHCAQRGSAAERLDVQPGDPVQVSVDADIAEAPWRVEYRMTDSKGKLAAACSKLFKYGQRHSYTVHPPTGYRLQLVNVYQLGKRVTATSQGVQFGVRGTWTALTAPHAQLPRPGETLCPATSG